MIRKEKLPPHIALNDGQHLPFRRRAANPAQLDRLADEAKRQKLRFRKLTHTGPAPTPVRGLYLYTNKKLVLTNEKETAPPPAEA